MIANMQVRIFINYYFSSDERIVIEVKIVAGILTIDE